MAKGRGLLGSGSKGTSNNAKFGKGTSGTAPGTINMTDPSKSGDPDVVAQRAAIAHRGTMQQKQLKSNKSTGLRIAKK